MPNWCSNILTISLLDETEEARKQLKTFVKEAKGKDTEIEFNNFIPMPEELAGTRSPSNIVPDSLYEKIHAEEVANYKKIKEDNPDFAHESYSISRSMSKDLNEKYGATNWYDWRVRNWGIKWSVVASKIGIGENSAIYEFQSPWCPPIEVFVKISEKYSLLNFSLEYEEPGECFRGTAEISTGEYSDDRDNYTPEYEEDEEE